MEIRLKHCKEKNLAQLVKISKETFSNAFESDNDPNDFKSYLNSAFSENTLLDQLRNKNSLFYFVYLAKTLVGYFKINEFEAQSDIKEAKGLELERIYVLEEYQGKQIGLQVLEKVTSLAKQKNKTYIWLGVWERNIRAIKWYQNNSFKKFGTHPYFIGADKQTDWLMKKEI